MSRLLPSLFFIAAVLAALLTLPNSVPSWACSTDTECEGLAVYVDAHLGLMHPWSH